MEFHLVNAGEFHVASEYIQSLLFEVLICLCIEIRGGKAEVYYINLQSIEKVFFAFLQLFNVGFRVKQKVIKLKVIVNIAGTVHLLENVKDLESEGIDLTLSEVHLSSHE